MNVLQYLRSRGFSPPEDAAYTRIRFWEGWYRGKSAFHEYRQYNGKDTIRRTRKSLCMAKTVCEDWANLQLNEKVQLQFEDAAASAPILDVLAQNLFIPRANRLLELTFAFGTGAMVEFLDAGQVVIDFIRASMVFPLSWDGDKITECAFGSIRMERGVKMLYLNLHLLDDRGQYYIENKLFRLHGGDSMTPAELPAGLQEVVYTRSPTPLFQILRPNTVNGADLDCPMGASIFAHSIDVLEGIDLVYDSYCNEFRLGRKRIMVPVTMARVVQEETGAVTPLFDANDTEFYVMNLGVDMDAQPKIQEINMELRADPHESALRTQLNLLSTKCGLGTDRYSFVQFANDAKTATEVMSEKSDLYQNVKKHEQVLNQVLLGVVAAVASLLGLAAPACQILFDDSIFEDSGALRVRDMQEVAQGLMQPYEFRMKWYGEDEVTAKAMTAAGLSDDDYMGFGGDGNGKET